jgi:hypothetical protein
MGEIIWFENDSNHLEGTGSNTSTISNSFQELMDLEIKTLGKIPKGIKAVYLNLAVKDSAPADNAGGAWIGQSYPVGSGPAGIKVMSSVANIRTAGSGWTQTDSNGKISFTSMASGSGTMNCWIVPSGIQLT